MTENLKAMQARLVDLDRAYRNGSPMVSDKDYDELFASYVALGGEKFTTDEAPGTIRHQVPLGSLAVVTTLDDLRRRFVGSCGVAVCSVKADGLAMSVVYKKGELHTAALRTGNGETGTDVTEAARHFVLNHTMTGADYSEIRGEVVLKTPVWQREFPEMKNPRNAAVGILKAGGPRARHLSFLPYDSTTIDTVNYHWKLRSLPGMATESIANFGLFQVGELKKPDFWDEEVWDAVLAATNPLTEEMLEILYTKIKALPYWSDGLVFRTVDEVEYAEAGAVGPDPKMACAFKYPPESTTTPVLDVDFDVGATGVICPRAILKPVTVAGTTVTYATLHNFDNIERLDLAIGDVVEVHKAGEIIPQVLKVVDRPSDRKAIPKPSACPCCGAATAQNATEEGEGVHLVCTNIRCGARRKAAILRWFRGFGVLGVGDVVAGKITSKLKPDEWLAPLWTWTLSDWDEVTGSTVLSEKLTLQIAQKTSGVSLRDFLRYASIPTVGDNKSTKLADTFLNLHAVTTASETKLVECLGAAGKRVREYLDDMGKDLQAMGELCGVKTHVPKSTNKLPGICFTGTLSKDRESFGEDVEASGKFSFHKSVTKTTKYLVVGDKVGATKIQAAKDKGVECITEQQLKELLQ